jgi:CrcB protein
VSLHYLLIALGSAAGGVCRAGLAAVLETRVTVLPLHTLLVNVIGCFLLSAINEAVLAGVGLRWRALLTTGFCGGFTTYSTFNYEATRLYGERGLAWGALYGGLTISLCLAAHFLGVATARLMLRR